MLTPAMQQYMTIKQKYPDCIILFRMGDFYEMFYEDAKTASRELGIALTSRGKGDANGTQNYAPIFLNSAQYNTTDCVFGQCIDTYSLNLDGQIRFSDDAANKFSMADLNQWTVEVWAYHLQKIPAP